MKNSIIAKLRKEGVITLYADYRSGSANDMSRFARTATITAPVNFSRKGANFQGAGFISYADNASCRNTTGSIMFLLGAGVHNAGRLFCARDAGGARLDVLTGTANVQLYNGTSAVSVATLINNKKGVSVDYANGGTGKLYIDGIYNADFSGTLSITGDDAAVAIGNNYVGSSVASSTIAAVIETSRILTATEHAQLYAELDAMKWPTKPFANTKKPNDNLLTDGDMEESGTTGWSITSTTMTKVAGARTGGAGLRIARLTNAGYALKAVLNVGSKYRITGWGRGDGGLGKPSIVQFDDIWIGTESTTWQYFDFTRVATTTSIGIRNLYGGYCEFDDVRIEQLPARTNFQTEFGVPVSVAARGGAIGQYLENTPFQFGDATGRFSVATDTVNGKLTKVISCSTAGILYIPTQKFNQTPAQAAYGEWKFQLYKGGETNYPIIYFVSNSTSGETNDYALSFSNTEAVQLGKKGIGFLFKSAASYIANSTWYNIKITRSAAGVFNVYIQGGAYKAWTLVSTVGGSGTNPVTDTTIAVATHIVLDLDAGDKIALGSLCNCNGITKKIL